MSAKDRKRFMQNLFYVSYINASASAITADELVRFSRLEQLFNESQSLLRIKVLCEQTRELTHDFLDYV